MKLTFNEAQGNGNKGSDAGDDVQFYNNCSNRTAKAVVTVVLVLCKLSNNHYDRVRFVMASEHNCCIRKNC